MPQWSPGRDPFPSHSIDKITEFKYLDELRFVRHAQVHVDKVPKSLWQLSANFRVQMKIHPEVGRPVVWKIKVPRGLFTDLTSVPEALWSVVGPIGTHLEASVVHDYLYMAWTDYRDEALKRDWNFADSVFEAGMEASDVDPFDHTVIFSAVRLLGWGVFKSKSYTLKHRMNEWLPLLNARHGRDTGAAAVPPTTSVLEGAANRRSISRARSRR